MPNFNFHWHQSNAEEVNGWEWQFQVVGSREWQFVQQVDLVDGCANCFQVTVELPRTAVLVRGRAIGLEDFSEWSKESPVHLPEPILVTAIMAGVLWIAILGLIRSQ